MFRFTLKPFIHPLFGKPRGALNAVPRNNAVESFVEPCNGSKEAVRACLKCRTCTYWKTTPNSTCKEIERLRSDIRRDQ